MALVRESAHCCVSTKTNIINCSIPKMVKQGETWFKPKIKPEISDVTIANDKYSVQFNLVMVR